jgi:hypothetical protein
MMEALGNEKGIGYYYRQFCESEDDEAFVGGTRSEVAWVTPNARYRWYVILYTKISPDCPLQLTFICDSSR